MRSFIGFDPVVGLDAAILPLVAYAVFGHLAPTYHESGRCHVCHGRRSFNAKGALRKIWREIEEGQEWIVDADRKDFFGSVSYERLLTLVNQRVADGRVLG